MNRKFATRAAVAAAALLLLTGTAMAGPTVAITSPEDGSEISRAGSPEVTVDGTVAFEQPVPTQRDVFFRWDGNASTCGEQYISEIDGPDGGNGCTFTFGSLTLVPGEEFVAAYPDSRGQITYPITVDASRKITGSVAIASLTPNAVVFEVRVYLGNQMLSTEVVPDPYVGSWFLTGAEEYPFEIDIPGSLDKVDVQSLHVEFVWKQYVNVGSTWMEHDNPASFITIPAWSASFDRTVEVNTGAGFSTAGVELSEELDTWTAARTTPEVGQHTISARAVQGDQVSEPHAIAITVTD